MSNLANNRISGEVVSLRNVSVRYHAHLGGRRSLKQLVVNLNKHNPQPVQQFWALRDINLSIAHGEVLGVVGRNGAGKSTLLSVVSRVLKPTDGTVSIRGSIAPLLSLGAGFDNELSGRENVYLLGALLGFSKKYIDDRYEDIVGFAEIQDFIEAPLKTYSSGMMARLGFAIATSAEADILLVDEVLAVGDERFRKKCEERIRSFRDRRMTILLVSHTLPTVIEMSTRVVWLERGRVMGDGDPQTVVRAYQDFMARR
jgi:ABC-type polysaccharide/polyol phosphate transport system ATPase subunit